ncbi:hypothetical protein F511_27220 [Dorcoceras hygrometricum]|uniref:Uncharacterized protein n=1 Tax=Dorcoceras hygrometricum TaxID=472368 RepID=A0A2Z7C8D3_9LAMI|nr:hypothetical protein F511_27220 [Dorcoceras hygrometricum]
MAGTAEEQPDPKEEQQAPADEHQAQADFIPTSPTDSGISLHYCLDLDNNDENQVPRSSSLDIVQFTAPQSDTDATPGLSTANSSVQPTINVTSRKSGLRGNESMTRGRVF